MATAKKKVVAKKSAAKKPAAKKAAPKKAAAKKPAKKAAPKKPKVKRKPSAALMKPVTPSATLAEVVGSKPVPRGQTAPPPQCPAWTTVSGRRSSS